jgi:hypothetical protein
MATLAFNLKSNIAFRFVPVRGSGCLWQFVCWCAMFALSLPTFAAILIRLSKHQIAMHLQ